MSELVHKLGIEWKLLAAQAVNFLILLWVLRKFVYGPIVEALAARRKAVMDAAADAHRIQQEVEAMEQRRREAHAIVEREADAIVQEARKAAEARAAEVLTDAEAKVQGLVEAAKRTIAEERAKMHDEVSHLAADVVLAAAERILGEALPDKAHERLAAEAVAEAKTRIR